MKEFAIIIDSEPRMYQALAIRHGLKACKSGMRLNRAYTPTNCFRTAERFTGKKYKVRGGAAEYDRAIHDLTTVIDLAQTRLQAVAS